MTKRKIRRIREPWWHWPAAVLVVLGWFALCGGAIFAFALFVSGPLNAWVDANPKVYAFGVLGGAAFAVIVLILAMAKNVVEAWRNPHWRNPK